MSKVFLQASQELSTKRGFQLTDQFCALSIPMAWRQEKGDGEKAAQHVFLDLPLPYPHIRKGLYLHNGRNSSK